MKKTSADRGPRRRPGEPNLESPILIIAPRRTADEREEKGPYSVRIHSKKMEICDPFLSLLAQREELNVSGRILVHFYMNYTFT